MWRYPYRVETMGRQFLFHDEASLINYNPGLLVEDDFYRRSSVNYADYRRYDYASAYKRYPEYYNGTRERSRFFPDPYSPRYLRQDDLEDYQPSRKRLKMENGFDVTYNELGYTDKQRMYNNVEKLNNETVTQSPQLNKDVLDPMKLSEQLQKHFGKPSSFSQLPTSSTSSESDLNHSFTNNHSNGLLVEQMKEVYDAFIAKEDPSTFDELWYISERDRNFKAKGGGGTCRNCMKIGHSAKTCKNPKKIPLCFICGSDDHEGEVCKNVRCSRCLKIGHFPEQCSWLEGERTICSLCKTPGHYDEVCPDLWRRYHLTISDVIVSQVKQNQNPLKFCYNCAEEGHFGHECHGARLDNYSYPSNPFVVSYGMQREIANTVVKKSKTSERSKI